MEGEGEGWSGVVEEAVEEESPDSRRERPWPAPDTFSCEGGFDADRLRVISRSGRSSASAP